MNVNNYVKDERTKQWRILSMQRQNEKGLVLGAIVTSYVAATC